MGSSPATAARTAAAPIAAALQMDSPTDGRAFLAIGMGVFDKSIDDGPDNPKPVVQHLGGCHKLVALQFDRVSQVPRHPTDLLTRRSVRLFGVKRADMTDQPCRRGLLVESDTRFLD